MAKVFKAFGNGEVFMASYCWVSQVSGMLSQISDLLDRAFIKRGAVLVSNSSMDFSGSCKGW